MDFIINDGYIDFDHTFNEFIINEYAKSTDLNILNDFNESNKSNVFNESNISNKKISRKYNVSTRPKKRGPYNKLTHRDREKLLVDVKKYQNNYIDKLLSRISRNNKLISDSLYKKFMKTKHNQNIKSIVKVNLFSSSFTFKYN